MADEAGGAGGAGGDAAAAAAGGGDKDAAAAAAASAASLVGGAGAKGGTSLAGGAGVQTEAEKTAAETAARATVEKDLAKELEGKTDAEKKELIDKKITENKTVADKAAAEKDKVPDKYADFKLPEGFEVNAEAMTGFHALAKDLSLSQDKAQKLVDFQASMEKSRGDAAVAEFDKTGNAWRDETVKSLGSDFSKAEANVGRFMERFGTPELRQLMDATHVGENIHLFKAMAAAGAKIGEGQMPDGSKGGAEPEQGKRWYPNMRAEIAGPAK